MFIFFYNFNLNNDLTPPAIPTPSLLRTILTILTGIIFTSVLLAYATYPLYRDSLPETNSILVKLFCGMIVSGISLLFCIF
jgi:cell division protein FtsL